jgi:hypothetical protein
VIERECLLARRGIIGVIEGTHKGRRGLRGAREAVVDQRVGEAGEVRAGNAVVKARTGGGTCQGLGGLEGWPLHAALTHRVVPEAIGIMAVRIAGGEGRDPLGHEGTARVGDRGRMPLVLHSRGAAFGEANLAIEAPAQERPTVRRQGPTFDSGSDGIASAGRTTSWLWRSIGQKHTSWRLDGMDASHRPFSQRLTRGVGFFMKNSG